jgi:hypothetical protein
MVDDGLPKVSVVQHIVVLRLDINKKNLQKSIINICEEVILTPFKAVCLKRLIVIHAPDIMFPLRLLFQYLLPPLGKSSAMDWIIISPVVLLLLIEQDMNGSEDLNSLVVVRFKT